MLKSKMKFVVALLMAIIMLFTCATCFAVDDDEEQILESNNEDVEISTVESDVYLIGKDVTIDYIVDGNAYIMANTVTITSQIGGDVFILANTVNIDGGYVYSNLFVCASTLNVNGMVYDLYSCAQNVTIGETGYVYRDAHTISNDFNILGAIGRNALASCENISFTSGEDVSSHGTVYGDLKYSSQNELTISKDYVEGEIEYTKIVASNSKAFDIQDFLGTLVVYIILAVLAYIVYTKLTPKFNGESSDILKNKFLPVIGYGLLSIVVGFIVTILLMFASANFKLMLLLLSIFIGAMLIFSLTFVIICANFIIEKAKLENIWQKLGIVALVTLALIVVELIPYVEGFIVSATIVIGAGTIVIHCLPKKED